ncbi:MAG: aspartate dehydrogenase [Clostridia bacterium]|nr:aspartate dehydrogenase [Clostridia bacterium]
MFGRKKAQAPAQTYDPEKETPVLLSSICTGETLAGFKDRETGHFRSVTLVKSPADIEEFKRRFGIEGEIRREY